MNHSNLSEENRQSLEVQAREYLEEAQALKQQNKFQASIEAAKQAAALYQQLEMWERCIESRNLIGGILYAIGKQPSEILTYLEETLGLADKYIEKTHPLFATIFYRLGFEYAQKEDSKMAGEYYQKALKIRKTTNGEDSFQVGFLYGYIGRNLYTQNDYDGSLAAFEKGLAILSNIKENIKQQAEIERGKSDVYCLYGYVLGMLGFYEKALFYLNKALDVGLKIGTSERILIGDIYNRIASTYSYIGEYDKALLFYKKGLRIWSFALGERHYFLADIKIKISSLLISTRAYEEAIPYLKEVVDACESSLKLEVSGKLLGYAYTQFSRIYTQKRDYNTAFIYIEKSIEINTKLFGERSIYVASNEYSMGEIYRFWQDYEKALEYYHRALEKSLSLGKTQYIVIGYNYHAIGRILAIQNKHLSALDSIQKSIQAFCPNFSESNIYKNPKLEDILFFRYVFFVFMYKAFVFFTYYQKKTKAIQDYEAALSCYQLVDELNDRFHQNYYSTQSKLILAANTAITNYKKGIYTALNAPSSIDRRTLAFRFSEKAKATVLYSSLQESIAKASANIPNELLQKEKDFRIELTYLRKNIQQQETRGKQKDEKLLQKLENDYFNLQQQYSHLIQDFEQNYPDYYQLKHQTQTTSIEEIQANLRENQWMISYFIGENHYYIFLIGKEEFEVLDLEKISGFETLVEDFLSAIQNHQFEEYAQKGYELYQELLQPLEMYLIDPSMDEEDTVQELIIIPHGILHYLPFEALLCTRPKSSGKVYVANDDEESLTKLYQSLDYALLHFEVSYHYSATLWHYLLSKQGERAPIDVSGFVGFAPVYEGALVANEREMGRKYAIGSDALMENLNEAAKVVGQWATRSEALRSDGTWTPLPYSKLETEGVANLFAQKGLSAQVFLHEKATKEQFQEVVAKSRFLLIAAHGVVNDKQPKLSGLVFYPTIDEYRISNTEYPISNSKPRTTDNESQFTNHQTDCILSMEETYHLNLQADLVVLSSCESGIGELAKGEGMMAVNRGFLYAGAKNVVSTLFKVYDRPSSLLTQYLFEAVLEGKSYAEALRTAKLKLLVLEEVDVKSWCGFVLIGN